MIVADEGVWLGGVGSAECSLKLGEWHQAQLALH
jgi:hypothetical protein